MIKTIILLTLASVISMHMPETHQDPQEAIVSERSMEHKGKTKGSEYGPFISPEITYVDLGTFRCTAYCPCCDCSEEYGKLTATGTTCQEGRTIAVDPDVIPYGTKVLINGHEYVAEDCGGAIEGNEIDIYMEDHAETDSFGVQYLEVQQVK